jgi:hypothetical protein
MRWVIRKESKTPRLRIFIRCSSPLLIPGSQGLNRMSLIRLRAQAVTYLRRLCFFCGHGVYHSVYGRVSAMGGLCLDAAVWLCLTA